ncbi:AEC family transporter [Jeotgalibacillus proteolyticus]|uniref:AEC family transporter n=1 Tax=Jeotgalibacillus proteolyticus TaxID=2082395 RepID=A0A2S5G8S1_9BACL|nr:AEC family transporter [Jeotgalibacillus proteolyticus]PPA69396.1 AEC family transporter [Jeotgalibacillus proteolyticus]
MSIFIQVMLPVLIILVLGYGLQKWKSLDIKPLSTVAIYIFTPMLIFQNVYSADLNNDYLTLVVFSLLLMILMIIITKIYTKIRNAKSSTESGLILSTAFMNSGNYGAPIVLFAYGEVAFDYAVSLLVIHLIMMNSFGLYYAARGSGGIKVALKALLEMPPTYAALLAIFMNSFNLQMPTNLMLMVDLLAPATIPLVMLILGMQLANISLKNFSIELLSFAIITRLFLSPLLAFIILYFIQVDPLIEKILILIAAMPSAANTVIYAVQYDSEPELVSSITLITTLLSIVTITGLLWVL